VHPVVAHLEPGQTGALALAGLQLHQVVAGVLGQTAIVVQQFGVEALADHAAVADHHRRVVDQAAREHVGKRRVGTNMVGQLIECGALAVYGEFTF
jgi:hypothetical protein